MFTYRYYEIRRHLPDFSNPKDLSEIIISRILSNEVLRFSHLADKVKVRDYIRSKGLGSILLHHYGYWNNVDSIELDSLPERFVLKTNRGEGGHDVCICRDKSQFDFASAKEKLQRTMYHHYLYDYQYESIEPMVLCEELIDTGSERQPTDYKFLCIHGEPVSIFVAMGRENGRAKFCSKSLMWEDLDDIRPKLRTSIEPTKPKHLTEMINIAKILCADFDLVRVDLYEYKDQVYFGELTFSPGGGLFSYTNEAVEKYGKLFNQL